jgi:hypothetical protein
MKVDNIYINTDFHFAKICIASIRYWYPTIPIYLIKDFGAGNFNTKTIENVWDVHIFNTNKKIFGWGFGKLEPLFVEPRHSFLVLDADTVLTGLVLNKASNVEAQFIVDEEIQSASRFNEIYYNLDRITELEECFVYPGYSFNSGQWFGTSGVVTRKDFERTLEWSEPPKPRFPNIVFNGDQAQLNFVFHKNEQLGTINVLRNKLMIWPENGNADFIEISNLKNKKEGYPYVIHWAGIKAKSINGLPRADILLFYKRFFNSKLNPIQRFLSNIMDNYFFIEQLYKKAINKVLKKLQNTVSF